LINHITKEFDYGNDIASALEDKIKEPYNLEQHKPTVQTSDANDMATRTAQNQQYEMEFQANYELFRKRSTTYKNNIVRAHAFLWEQCSKGMKNKIKLMTAFQDVIRGNPVELLDAIKYNC